jgi:hypothetical protein
MTQGSGSGSDNYGGGDRADTPRRDDPECRGPGDATRRERAIDDSIESVVAALKRVHRVSQMASALGHAGEPAAGRSLIFDFVDVHARYLRNVLGLAARAHDQISDLFGSSYAAPAQLKEKSVDVTLRRVDHIAVGVFRLHNATACAVLVDFPAVADFFEVGSGTAKTNVPLVFRVKIPPPSTEAAGCGTAEVASSAVPPDGVLEVTAEISISSSDWGGKAWSAEAVIHTNAAHDLGLVLELEPAHE